MDSQKNRRVFFALGIWALLTFLLFSTGVVNRQKVWANPQLSWEAGESYSAESSAYGVKSSGPYLDLAAGTYRLKWQIDGDGANEIRLTSSNDARIVPDVLTVKPGEWEGEAVFELLDPAHSFSIGVTFASGTKMKYYSLRLYSPEYTDYAFLLSGLLLGAIVLYTLYCHGRLSRERIALLALLVVAVLLASAPSLQDDTNKGWDVQFHAARVANLADALRTGQFPARVGGFSYNGYGAATSVFYPDLFLYPWALMQLCGCSMSFVLNSLVVVFGMVTAGLCYYAARKLALSKDGATASAVLYIFCTYRLSAAYGGYMMGELIAMTFVPPFIAALWDTLFGNERRWKELALWSTAVFYAHVLTTLLCAFLSVILLVFSLPSHARRKTGYFSTVFAIGLTLLLCLRQIIPLIQLYFSGVNSMNMQFGFDQSTLSLNELMSPTGRLGITLILFSLVAFTAAVNEKESETSQCFRLFLGIAYALAFSTTQFFPWGYVVKLTHEVVTVLQFPWRLLLLTAALLSLVGGYGAQKNFRSKAAVIVLIVSTITVTPILQNMTGGERGVRFGEGANPYMVYPEYQIEGTDVNDTRSREPVTDGDLTLSDYHKDGTNVSAQVSSADGGTLTLPLFAFPGYEVRLNGQRTQWERGRNNCLKVTVPPGFEGGLRVRYAGFALWKALDAVAAVTVVCLLADAVRRRRKGAKHADEEG
ncbi:MAG: hypothetical protein IJ573_01125 [Clostridia bacterium]|nr:hypothetical protein [Clostridia bacterium]